MPTITLTNPTKSLSKLSGVFTKHSLKKLSDINQNPYYLLVNPDNPDDAYFCFAKTVVAGWNQLEQAFEQNASLSSVNLERTLAKGFCGVWQNSVYQESEKGMRIYKQVVRVEIS